MNDLEIPKADEFAEGPEEEVSEVPSAYPWIQPMKAAFHFDSVEGFGDWRILVSTRADRDLRTAKKSDQKLFKIILKKIRCGQVPLIVP